VRRNNADNSDSQVLHKTFLRTASCGRNVASSNWKRYYPRNALSAASCGQDIQASFPQQHLSFSLIYSVKQFSFTDNTKKEFGLPTRKFNSFAQASKEAAISRLYGAFLHFSFGICKECNLFPKLCDNCRPCLLSLLHFLSNM